MKNIMLYAVGCLLVAVNTWATDIKRELEYSDQILKTLGIGQIVWLQAGSHQFLGIYTETEQTVHAGAAIILHDRGGQPDQKPLIHALRTELPKHQWATLSLQLPVREPGAGNEAYYELFPEVVLRIQAAIDYLKKSDIDNIVLVGYGLGGLMALYAESQLANPFKAVTAVSLPVPETEKPMAQTLVFIERIEIPLLDIYGGLDIPEVTDTALKRRMAAKENQGYRQVKLNEVGYLFQHDEGLVVKRVYSWLRRVMAQLELQQEGREEKP
ncbi:MAG: DUF3530 family protein [Gammaproteobacteria bacterium]